jgi:hypothetical protein
MKRHIRAKHPSQFESKKKIYAAADYGFTEDELGMMYCLSMIFLHDLSVTSGLILLQFPVTAENPSNVPYAVNLTRLKLKLLSTYQHITQKERSESYVSAAVLYAKI